ncbi:helix-turn-helix domain-containing protein [Paenibacillus sp. QZ-Y1]|uniref:helix-turn-helix domain-containing protein n=1 Tax=Paenibacillus sp. QZ-Y1 TaxID=3414511 RepID=UPI003F797DAD
MNNIELTIIGDQAKRLREHAGVSIEEMVSHMSITKEKLNAFEKGYVSSLEGANHVFHLYLRTLNNIYIEQEKPFLKVVEDFCHTNNINYSSFVDAFVEGNVSLILNLNDKKESLNLLKQREMLLLKLTDASISLSNSADEMQNEYKKMEFFTGNYDDTSEKYCAALDKLEIILDVLVEDEGFNRIASKIKEKFELDEENGFKDYSKEIYQDLLYSIED